MTEIEEKLKELDVLLARLSADGLLSMDVLAARAGAFTEALVDAYPDIAAACRTLAAENARLREALDWVQSLLEVKPDSPNLALDAISSTLKADDFTVGTCPECGARAYHWGNMIAECHAGGCSRGKDATPIMRQCGGAS